MSGIYSSHTHTRTHFKTTRKIMVRLQTYNRSHQRIMYSFSQSKLSVLFPVVVCVWCVCMWCVCVRVYMCVYICVCGVWCMYVVCGVCMHMCVHVCGVCMRMCVCCWCVRVCIARSVESRQTITRFERMRHFIYVRVCA